MHVRTATITIKQLHIRHAVINNIQLLLIDFFTIRLKMSAELKNIYLSFVLCLRRYLQPLKMEVSTQN